VRSYGQYCPIARASEVFAERWTPIILRNMVMVGCTTFGEISAGAPGLSRTLLTQRLRQLEQFGVIEVRPKTRGRGVTYELTEAGRALRNVLLELGQWGERWLELGEQHTNPCLVLWAWCTAYLARERLPDRRVVIRFDFSDQPPDGRRVWMIVDNGDAELCKRHPKFDEDLIVQTDARTFARWHLKQIEWMDAVRAGRITVIGPRALATALPTWNRRDFADTGSETLASAQ
jgi:DNA-binding HxlR family transcriptional regulator